MAKYRKVDPRIWNDAKFRSLSDHGKLVFFFLLTHPHMTALGAMRATIPGLAAEMGWEPEAFREAFREGLAKGMAKHDSEACFVWLPKFLKYNGPESPNVVKAWAGALDYLPECPLKDSLIQYVKGYAEALPEAFSKALPEAFAKSMPNQEQEQEQEQEQKKPTVPRKRGTEYADEFELVWKQYPKRNGGNPKPKAWKAWQARIREGHTPEEMTAGVERYRRWLEAHGKVGTEFVKQASTFFGPEKSFQETWAVMQAVGEDFFVGGH